MNNEQEIWKDVEGYEGLYQVSSLGRMRSSNGGRSREWRIMFGSQSGNEHICVHLSRHNKVQTVGVHRLVAMAFVDGYQPGLVVNHKDENPLNNRADNLEWITVAANNRYGTKTYRMSQKMKGNPINTFRKLERKTEVESIEGEEWRDIEGYEGHYLVSNFGRIRSLKPRGGVNPILCHCVRKDGRHSVHLYKDGKCSGRNVHDLVARAFVDGYRDGTEVNHKDENPHNNRADNLEWVTHSENINYGTRNQRCQQKRGVAIVQSDDEGNVIAIYPSIREASRQLSIRESNIRLCLRGKRKHVGGWCWHRKEKSY